MEPLLRWLQVGGSGYNHAYPQDNTPQDTNQHAPNKEFTDTLSNGSFADDLLCVTHTLNVLHIQANKLPRYSNWAALQVSGSKTKVTGILHRANDTGIYGRDSSTQPKDKIKVQGHYT